MGNVLEVKNIEKYYGNKSNLTKAIDILVFKCKQENMLESWEQAEVEKQHY